MPSPHELARMQDDLNFKQTEMHKSEATASTLAGGKLSIMTFQILSCFTEEKFNNILFSILSVTYNKQQHCSKGKNQCNNNNNYI